jgi:hypothetical protein
MSGIFNGTSSVISVGQSVVGTADLDYGVLVCAWFKQSAAPSGTQSMFSAHNALTGGNIRTIQLATLSTQKLFIRHRGSTANGDLTSTNIWPTSTWVAAMGEFIATNSRTLRFNDEATDANSTSTGTGVNAVETRIGSINSASQFFSGRIAEVGVWALTNQTHRDAIIADFKASKRPNLCAHSEKLVLYQPLKSGVNEDGCVGPAMTETNVTWDAEDHPIDYGGFQPWYVQPESGRFVG